MTGLLTLWGLTKLYDGVAALDSFSFDFDGGTAYGLIGPNGAGKTTLLNLVSGFTMPDKGTVLFQATDISKCPAYARCNLGIIRSFQENRLARGLTVIDNLMLGIPGQVGEQPLAALVRPHEVSKSNELARSRAMAILSNFGFSKLANSMAGTLSFGEQKIVDVLCCLAAGPQLLLLDEPVAGLSPAMREEMVHIVQRYVAAQGSTAIIIEHDLEFIERTVTKTLFLSAGELIASGSLDEVRRNKFVLDSYLVGGVKKGHGYR